MWSSASVIVRFRLGREHVVLQVLRSAKAISTRLRVALGENPQSLYRA